MVTDQLFWAVCTGLVFLPSNVGKAGFARDGLPVGAQIVVGHYPDRESLASSSMLEEEYHGFEQPPGF